MRSYIVLCLFALMPNLVEGQSPNALDKLIHLAHQGDRVNVAFSPDSKTLATGGQDNQIRFWEVATQKQRLAISAHRAPAGVSRLAYFPNGKVLASASWAGDGTIRLWDSATGVQKKLIGTNKGGVSVLAVSPDGKFLAWGNAGTIEFYDLKNDRSAHSVSRKYAMDSAVFSPDSRLLATAQGDGRVYLFEAATGKPVRNFLAAASTATGSQAVAFTPDNKILATASRKLRLWNVATGEEIADLGPPAESPFCVAISPDGRLLASGVMQGPLRLWNLKTRKEIHAWNETAVSVAFSPDSRWLAFGNRGSTGGAYLVNVGAASK